MTTSQVPWKSMSRIAAMAKRLLANSSSSICWRNTRNGLTVLKALMPPRPKAAGLALPAGDGGVLPPADAPPIRDGEEGVHTDAADSHDQEPARELDPSGKRPNR